tara:strand:+ start:73 stop:516 length:444 start_codon:yes stop_codon:yes gene_type:complete
MSTLLADTIRKTGGTAGVDIRVKNTSVYESDGGTSVTQNIVQSVAKAWVNFTGVSSTSSRDSFNITSLTDSGTGHTTIALTSSMANANYTGSWFTNSDASSGITNLSNNYAGNFAVRATGSYQTQCWATNGGADAFHNDSTVFGDLA